MKNVVFLMICMEKWWCVKGLVRWGVVHLTMNRVSIKSYHCFISAQNSTIQTIFRTRNNEVPTPDPFIETYFALRG